MTAESVRAEFQQFAADVMKSDDEELVPFRHLVNPKSGPVMIKLIRAVTKYRQGKSLWLSRDVKNLD